MEQGEDLGHGIRRFQRRMDQPVDEGASHDHHILVTSVGRFAGHLDHDLPVSKTKSTSREEERHDGIQEVVDPTLPLAVTVGLWKIWR